MKTRNIRTMMLALVAAMAVNVSAQKSVMQAFDKIRKAKGVVVLSVDNKKSESVAPALPWRCKIMELSIPKAKDAAVVMPQLYKAFLEDSEREGVSYYAELPPLAYNATPEAKAARKKIAVNYADERPPVIIGEDPSYEVWVLRCSSKAHLNGRVVVAMEFKKMANGRVDVRLYEIEGVNCRLMEDTPKVPHGDVVPMPQIRKDDIITRMHFYRDTYNGEDNSDNSALLLNMTEYLNANWEKASDAQQNMIMLILQDMAGRSKAKMHRDLINQCGRSLKNANGADNDVVRRIELYIEDIKACTTMSQENEVLKQVKSYVSAQVRSGMDAKTANAVYEKLIQMKKALTTMYQENEVANIVRLLEKN